MIRETWMFVRWGSCCRCGADESRDPSVNLVNRKQSEATSPPRTHTVIWRYQSSVVASVKTRNTQVNNIAATLEAEVSLRNRSVTSTNGAKGRCWAKLFPLKCSGVVKKRQGQLTAVLLASLACSRFSKCLIGRHFILHISYILIVSLSPDLRGHLLRH